MLSLRNLPELESLNKVIGIFFYGRGGSFFFQSLLDNHPRILTIPGTYIDSFYDFWKLFGHLSKETIVEKFIHYYEYFFDVESTIHLHGNGEPISMSSNFHQMGENCDQRLEISREFFVKTLKKLIGSEQTFTRKFFFQAIHLSYAIALEHPFEQIKGIPVIAFQLHTPSLFKATELLSDFPDAKIIHCVRDPIQSLGSHIKNYKGLSDINVLLWLILNNIFRGGCPLSEEYRRCSFALRLEDLHTKSQATLAKVCELIDIEWNDSLMQSTFNGLKWWNIKGTDKVSGFNTKIISKRHDDVFSMFDRFRLSVLLNSKYKKWNYTPYEEWNNYPLMHELLQFPFKFEDVYFTNGRNDPQNREMIKQFFLEFWSEYFQSMSTDKELTLITPDG